VYTTTSPFGGSQDAGEETAGAPEKALPGWLEGTRGDRLGINLPSRTRSQLNSPQPSGPDRGTTEAPGAVELRTQEGDHAGVKSQDVV